MVWGAPQEPAKIFANKRAERDGGGQAIVACQNSLATEADRGDQLERSEVVEVLGVRRVDREGCER